MGETPLHELIRRVEDFEFDEGHPSLTFTRRLARENGWSLGYAQRVAAEYKRFAVMAVAAGRPVTPPEDVDQAWHLHLTYTRSYWDRFCGEALGTPLHHNPTAGGTTEHAKFYEWYAETLACYRRLFQESPPADIWPHPTQRFANAGAGRWVDPSQYWLIRKNWFSLRRLRLTKLAGLSLLMLLLIVGCGPQGVRTLNPFDFTGIEFLIFYAALIGIGVAVSVWCRLKLPRETAPVRFELADDVQSGSPYAVAALVNGPRGVVFTAIANLYSRGHLKIKELTEKAFLGLGTKKKQVLVRDEPLPADAAEIERIIAAAADDEGNVEMKYIIEAGLPIGEAYRDRLREAGLVEHDPPAHMGHRTIPGLVMGSVFVIGLIKFFVGMSRVKPVGFLFFLLIVTLVLALFFLLSKRYLTPAGLRLAWKLKKQHKPLMDSKAPSAQLSVSDIALATAVYGAVAWRNHEGALADLYGTMQSNQVFAGAGNPGGGGCGGGGCSGGGGGCGGGGCGGCGGCGG